MLSISITDDEKARVRASIFHHLAGMVLVPTVKALWDRKVFEQLRDLSKPVGLDQIIKETHGNGGYLRVALRLLASCGWIQERKEKNTSNVHYSLTSKGVVAMNLVPLFGEVVSFIPKAIFLEDFLFGKSEEPVVSSLQTLALRSMEHWSIPIEEDPKKAEVHHQVRQYLDGMLVGPAMVALARGGILERLGRGPLDLSSVSANQTSLSLIFDLLVTEGWAAREETRARLTPAGLYAARIATSYGVTASYMPLMNVLSTLLFGNPRILRFDETGSELLVNRGMNIWGSGGAHKTYFKKVDEIIVEIFNRPIEEQPEGICDMGCGDGTLLEHLYCVVKNQTSRGAMLDKHPLMIVGADFNKVARRITKQNLRKSKIPSHFVISGDINRPAQLAGDLEALGQDIHSLLHVRSFLDHNRPYLPPANYVKGTRTGNSTGVFAYLGDEIPSDELEENLVRHLRRWAPFVGRFGLLVLELHTLPPELTAANLGKTPAVAYDGTHGYSDQYLVELPVFLKCAREAGLQADHRYQVKFPPSELATVSVNFFTALANRFD